VFGLISQNVELGLGFTISVAHSLHLVVFYLSHLLHHWLFWHSRNFISLLFTLALIELNGIWTENQFWSAHRGIDPAEFHIFDATNFTAGSWVAGLAVYPTECAVSGRRIVNISIVSLLAVGYTETKCIWVQSILLCSIGGRCERAWWFCWIGEKLQTILASVASDNKACTYRVLKALLATIDRCWTFFIILIMEVLLLQLVSLLS